MKYLKFAVKDMTITRKSWDKTALITGAVNYFGMEFEFDEDFNMIEGTKSIELFKNRTKKRIELSDGKCMIPNEFLRDKNAIEFRVLSGETIATPWTSVNITESGMIEPDEPEEEIPEGLSYVKSPSGENHIAQVREGNAGLEYTKDGLEWKPYDGSSETEAIVKLRDDESTALTIATKVNEIIDILAKRKIVSASECPIGEAAFKADKTDYGNFGNNQAYYGQDHANIVWDGTSATVTGKLKYVKQETFSKLKADGNYFAFALSDWFKGKPITVQNGKKTSNVTDTDIVCLVGEDKQSITVKYNDTVIAVFDLSGVELEAKQE